MIRRAALLILAFALATSAAAAQHRIVWDRAGAQTADVTCDGRPDRIMTGHRGKTLIVLVTSGAATVARYRFGIDADRQDAVCRLPVQIQTYPIECTDELAGRLPGCRAIRRCEAFSVADHSCDSLNFYWNASARRLEWYRH